MPPKLVQVTLDNGLLVILQEVRSAPVVSTWLWYRVGSRNEVEGLTGLSHWVEHMMFKGSEGFPRGEIMRAVDRCGGYINAMTSHDFTAYYATLPSDHADLALRIEADRMTGALFDPDEVAAERTVVIAEREGSENEPRYVLAEELTAAAFRLHPYHHQTVGWKEDLLQITRDQLYAHYRGHYAPNNAILVAVGDFDAEVHLARIEELFGDIPAGQLPADTTRAEPPQRGERRVTVRLPGSAPMVRIAYHTPAAAHPDFVPLVIADAVLSGGKAMFAFGDSPSRSARLYRALVETGLASSAGSSYSPSLDPYLLTLGATVRDGRSLDEVEAALLAEIERLQCEPPTPRELQVAIRQTQAQFAYNSESVTDRALTLGFLEIVDRHERMETIFEELAAVTPEDVRRVARQYLNQDNRIVGRFAPIEEYTAGGDERAGGGEDDEGMECAGGAAPCAYWDIPRHGMCAYRSGIGPDTVLREQLPNGITVLAWENPASAAVTLRGEMLPGGLHESDDVAGLAHVTAAMLRRGTAQRSFPEINQALDDVGASLGFGSDEDRTTFGGRALAGDYDLLVDLLAEMLQAPAFAESELEKLRGQVLTHLRILEADTGYRADRALLEGLYPAGHPYARPTLGTRATMAALQRGQLQAFHGAHYHPATMTISVAGAVPPDRAVARLREALGGWRPAATPPRWSVSIVSTPERIIETRVPLPGKSQVDLSWGVVALARTAPDYYAAMMGDVILGRLGLMGRLGEAVRDRQGLAYYVSSDLASGLGPQPWTVDASVHPENVAKAVESILGEIARLREELVAPAELDDCRSYLAGALPLRMETNEGVAGYLLAISRYGLGWDYLQRYPEIIGAVTREEIRAAAARYLTLDRYVLSMSGTFC